MRIGLVSVIFASACMAIAPAQQPGGRSEAAKPAPPDNEEVARLYEDDQADRRPEVGKVIDPSVIVPRDREREGRIKALYRAGELRTGKDYHRAAMVLQHAARPEDF